MAIVLLFNFDFLKRFVRSCLSRDRTNLLNNRSFQHRFKATKRLLNRYDCHSAIATVLATQELARAIAQLEPTSIPELLDTLHDVLNDAEKIAPASQINRSTSHLAAREHLDNYQLQLERRYQQLQQLYQQIQIDRL